MGAPPFLRPTRPSSSRCCGEQAGLDGLGQLDLGGGVEQRGAGDLVEVQADAVAALDLTLVAGGGQSRRLAPFLQVDRPAGVRSAGPVMFQRLVWSGDSLGRSPVGATGSPVSTRRALSPVPTRWWATKLQLDALLQALLSDRSVPAWGESMRRPRIRPSPSCPQGPVETVWTRGCACGVLDAFCGQRATVGKECGEVRVALVAGHPGHVEISHRSPQGQWGPDEDCGSGRWETHWQVAMMGSWTWWESLVRCGIIAAPPSGAAETRTLRGPTPAFWGALLLGRSEGRQLRFADGKASTRPGPVCAVSKRTVTTPRPIPTPTRGRAPRAPRPCPVPSHGVVRRATTAASVASSAVSSSSSSGNRSSWIQPPGPRRPRRAGGLHWRCPVRRAGAGRSGRFCRPSSEGSGRVAQG